MLYYNAQTQALYVQHLTFDTGNTWKHTQAYTNRGTHTTPAVALHEKAHSLGALAPVLSGLHSKWPPHDHTHYSLGRQALSGLRLPGCKQWFMAQGSVKGAASPRAAWRRGEQRPFWRWGWIKSLPTELNPVETVQAEGRQKWNGQRFLCESEANMSGSASDTKL